MVTPNSLILYYELDHRYLVDERRSMSDPCSVLCRGLVQTAREAGEGFETKTNGHGMGLRIMRYRAQCIGGSCEVPTGARKGTTVYCRVPLGAQPSLSMIS